MYNFISFLGIFVLIGVAWLFSANRRALNWRVVVFGVSVQMVMVASVAGTFYTGGPAMIIGK